ncbi:hypothetical protein ACB092_09G049400 [Castanea dentata]
MEQAHERKEQIQELSSEKQLMLSYPPTDPQSYPWLVICDGYDKERQTFFSISKDYFHTRNIPEMCNKLIYTSCDGWLVLKDIDSKNLCLLNPTSKEMMQLPTLEDITDQFDCILTATPSDPYNQCYVLFIDPPTCTFSFCQLGDKKFYKQTLQANGSVFVKSATFHGGKIYLLIYFGISGSLSYTAEFVGGEIRFNKLAIERFDKSLPADVVCYRDYLIESCGELLLVNQMFFGSYRRKVYGFVIFRMDSSKNAWVQVKNIGERAIFISERSKISCFVAENGVKRNSIYFTMTFSRFLYVFDLEDDTITKFLPCPTVACRELDLDWVILK